MEFRHLVPSLCTVAILTATTPGEAQDFTIDEILAPGYPFELVSATRTDRIAWIEYERGERNVYTAVGPDFQPIRLTRYEGDDGIDLSGLQISADGSTLTYIRGHAPNRDGWIANPTSNVSGGSRTVWTVAAEGGTPRRIVDTVNYVLSPDGRWIAYAREGQIHRVSVTARGEGSDAAPFVRAYGDNGDPVWSPEGGRLAYTSDREDHSYVAIYDPDRPQITYLAPGVDYDTAPVWSPDGRQVAFIRRPGLPFGGERNARFGQPDDQGGADRPGLENSTFAGGYTMSIWVADVVSGTGRELWHNEPGDSRFDDVRSLFWAGDRILFESEPGNWRHYYSIPTSGTSEPPVELTPGEGFVEQIAVSTDGAYLFYATNVDDLHRRHIWRVSTEGGEPQRITSGNGAETHPVALASGNGIALLSAGPAQPQSVAIVSASGGSPRIIRPQLTNEFPTANHVQPENVTLQAEDGFEFYNQLFLPNDLRPGEQRPAMVFIHGGSRRQMLLAYHYLHFYHMAYAMNQYFANKGYIVLSVNYRSGIGYGEAFRNAPGRGRQGNTEYLDIRAAGRYLQSREDVDPDRVGLWGLSYGGILTAQGLARDSEVFAAGVDIAGVHLWGNSIDTTAVSYQSSAISAIDKWTSPVLLIHGDDDRNVEFSQTVGLVQLLRAHDIYHELIVYPDDVHSSLLHHRWLRSFSATDDFFDRFLLNRTTRSDAEARMRER